MPIPAVAYYYLGAAAVGTYLIVKNMKKVSVPSAEALNAPTAAQRAADPRIDRQIDATLFAVQKASPAVIDAADAASAAATGVTFPKDDFSGDAEALGVSLETLNAAAASLGITTKQFVFANDPGLFDRGFQNVKNAQG